MSPHEEYEIFLYNQKISLSSRQKPRLNPNFRIGDNVW